MTDRELKKLSRTELLELLLEQSRENECLRVQVKKAEQALSDRAIIINNAGSIAEAALSLNGVFEAAQKAAVQYLENVQRLSGDQQSICKKMEEEARQKADTLLSQTEQNCRQMESETKAKCEQMTAEAREKASAYWMDAKRQMDTYCAQRDALRELMSSVSGKDTP